MKPLIIAACLLAALPAAASDGVLEINRTCAIQTGCFPGDAAGFPVEITQPGSYRLTGNVFLSVISDATVDVIQIDADDVALDLGGFTVFCRNVVLLGGVCAGSATGIVSTGDGTVVTNGSVRGMPGSGISLGDGARVERVTAHHNAMYGINAGVGSIVTNSTASDNGWTGIFGGSGSVIVECLSFRNDEGITANPGSDVSNNVVRDNAQVGILCFTGCKIAGNTVRGNDGPGIESVGANVRDNSVSANVVGLQVGFSRTVYSGNVFLSNSADPVSVSATGIGVNLGGNYCFGTGTSSSACP